MPSEFMIALISKPRVSCVPNMFCPKCGTDLPEDSQFCRKCGRSLNVAPVGGATGTGGAALAAPKPRPRIALWILLLLLLLLIVWAVWQRSQRYIGAKASPQLIPPQLILPQLHKVTVGTGAITVRAASYAYYTLAVPAGAKNVTLQGRFRAAGGIGNDIEVFLLSQDDYTNWQNGHAARALYNSGKVTVGEVGAVLPNVAGTYYLVFNNKFSLLTPKAVEESLILSYYQ